MTPAPRRPAGRPWRRLAVLVLVLGAGLQVGATSAAATPGGGSSAAAPAVPLSSSTVAGTTTWATLAMGHLDDPLNTFWQLLALPAGASWRMTTPPGVASNGGLIASTAPTSVLAGFGPSQDLRFSPLARTADQGSTWDPGVLPAGLSRLPDALAATGNESLALLSTAAGTVVTTSGGLSTWTRVTTTAALRRRRAAAGCDLRSLTAVSLDAAGGTLVGGSCARGGRAGLFLLSSTGWSQTGPGVFSGGSTTEVVRIDQTAAGTAALVSVGSGQAARLVGLWSSDGLHTWAVSAGLRLGRASLLSTGTTAAGGFVVALRGGAGPSSAAVLAPAAPRWQVLPALPSGTTSVTATPGAGYDALVPAGTTLSVYGLVGGGWARIQRLQVPIPYGSSS